MNLNLLNIDPFQADIPEVIENTLNYGLFVATCCMFNKKGTLLAVGYDDGRCIIWDFDTRGVARVLVNHHQPVMSVSWSRNGRKLLTAGDWKIISWDVVTGQIDDSIIFDTSVIQAIMHPKKNNICLVFLYGGRPVLVDLISKEKKSLPVSFDEASHNKRNLSAFTGTFDKKGEKLYITNKGVITIIDPNTLKVLNTVKAVGTVRSMQFSKKGDWYLINSGDRIRVFDTKSNTQIMDFHDPVNKTQWKKCCFSSDDDFIIGGSAAKASHNIYIWNRTYGQLLKMLDGPKEALFDLQWHPTRPLIASCAAQGNIFIWATNYTYFQNWSAYAPDFAELEENVEYIEREDEFDVIDEGERLKKKRRAAEENDKEVDILTIDKLSSDDEDDLFFLPTVPDPDPKE